MYRPTSGPWRAANLSDVQTSEGVTVASCPTFKVGVNTAVGNARLIAAAPDLLAALEFMLCGRADDGRTFDREEVARIIARAKGYGDA